MEGAGVHKDFVESAKIRYRELLPYFKAEAGELPIQLLPLSREYDIFLTFTVNEKASEALLDFFYGLRNCFFHGDLKQTFGEKKGAMTSFRNSIDGTECRWYANRDNAGERQAGFWTSMALSWFKAYWLGAYRYHPSKVLQSLKLGYSVVSNMLGFLNSYVNCLLRAADAFVQVHFEFLHSTHSFQETLGCPKDSLSNPWDKSPHFDLALGNLMFF